MKNPKIYVELILQSIHHIEEYVRNYNKLTFSKERMRYDAILRNLQTMAEADIVWSIIDSELKQIKMVMVEISKSSK